MNRRATHPRRRGAAVVSILVAMALLQVLIAAIVLSGTRTDELTTLRLETVRAFHAAEAGANMAAREIMLGIDEDADGGIGSISDDGNAANDPALGGARLSAEVTIAGGTSTVTVTGRSGQSVRRVQLVIGQ